MIRSSRSIVSVVVVLASSFAFVGGCSSKDSGPEPDPYATLREELNKCVLGNPCTSDFCITDKNNPNSPVLTCDKAQPQGPFDGTFVSPGCYMVLPESKHPAWCDSVLTPQLATCIDEIFGYSVTCNDSKHVLEPTNGTGGSGGSAGTSGTAGSSGTSGSSGSAGSAGSAAGSAGAAGSSGAAAGSAGTAGTAGTSGSAGSAGSGGSDPCSGVTVGTSCLQWGQCAHCNDVRCDGGVWTPDALSTCGNAGTGGASGSSGSAGTAGSAGSTAGSSGASGAGAAGASGSAGTAGSAGASGAGAAGTSGSSGSAGTSGTAGSSGTSGSSGSAGTAGSAAGSAGAAGSSGAAAGSAGTSGSAGSVGTAPMCPVKPNGKPDFTCKPGGPCTDENGQCYYNEMIGGELHIALLSCTMCDPSHPEYGYNLRDQQSCADIMPWCEYPDGIFATYPTGTGGAAGASGAAGSSGSGTGGASGSAGSSGTSGSAGSGGSPSQTQLIIIWVPPMTYSPQDMVGAPAWVESGNPEFWGTSATQPYGLLATLVPTGGFYSAPLNFVAGDSVVNANVKFFSSACSGNASVAPGWHGDFGVGLCGGSRGLAQPVSKYMGKFYVYKGSTLVSVTYYDNSQDAGNAYGQYTYAMQFQVP